MDAFGIGAAVRGAVQVYFHSARQTGRTAALINSLQPGDRVVCMSEPQARNLRYRLQHQDIEATVVVVPPGNPQKLFELNTSSGRTVLDHNWLEQYYLDQLRHADSNIADWERHLSGYGQAHRETRAAAKEIIKWRIQP